MIFLLFKTKQNRRELWATFGHCSEKKKKKKKKKLRPIEADVDT